MDNNFENLNSKKPKYIVSILVLAIVLAVFLIWFSNYESTATVKISSSGNTITITRLNANQSDAKTIQGNNTLSARLHSGTYSVSVSNRQFASERIVIVQGHKNQTLVINLSSAGVIEPVSDEAAYDISASNTGLTFVDFNSKNIYMFSSANTRVNVLSNGKINGIKWANPSLGIAQDSGGNLYVIENGVASLLTAPVVVGENNYAVSPSGNIYISNGSSVYEGSVGEAFKPIYSSSIRVSVAAASNSAVLLQTSSGTDQAGDDKNAKLVVIDSSGSQHMTSGEFYEAAWSPNGNYLVVSSDKSSIIYNSGLSEVAQLPSNNVSSPIWLSNDVVLYGTTGDVWSYNLQTKQANVIANVSEYGYVSQINLNQDGSYAYILIQNTQTNGNNFFLGRFGLSGQAVSGLAQQLQVYLPNTVNGCSIGYINFVSPPRIVISGGDASPGQACIQQAQTYLQGYGINSSELEYGVEN